MTVTGQVVFASTNNYLGPVSEVRLTFYPSAFDPPYSDCLSVRGGQAIVLPCWGVPFNKLDDPRYRLTMEYKPAAMGEWSYLNTKSAKWVLLDL